MLNAKEIDIARLPSVPLAQRADLPDCAAIYFVVAPDKSVLYIGKAVCLLLRWRSHHRLEQIPERSSIAWLTVADIAALRGLEQTLIRRFRPSLNWLRHSGPTEDSETVAFRIPEWAKRHYEDVATKERRNLSQVLRLVLEDHARGQCARKLVKVADNARPAPR